MTTPPLPASPCVRVHLGYGEGTPLRAGSRFYLSYSGSAPSGADCTTLASDVADAWAAHIAPFVSNEQALLLVDVIDIATDHGLSGQWTGEHDGALTGTAVPDQCVTNVEFGIGRRYRGGKPRMFIPGPTTAQQLSKASWTAAHVAAASSGTAAFFAALEALSVGSMGTLNHVSLSYYQGFTNHANTSGRERAVPTYRTSALVDNVTGYFAKGVMGSQRRRRTSTTP